MDACQFYFEESQREVANDRRLNFFSVAPSFGDEMKKLQKIFIYLTTWNFAMYAFWLSTKQWHRLLVFVVSLLVDILFEDIFVA